MPTGVGCPALRFSVSPALPGGLAFCTGTGTLSGTPTEVSCEVVYTVAAVVAAVHNEITVTYPLRITVEAGPVPLSAIVKDDECKGKIITIK